MRVQGKIIKSGNWWAVEIPILLIHTQGRSKSEAYKMAKDAVEALVEAREFKATIYPGEGHDFTLGSNSERILMALILRQQRSYHKLTVREVARRLGSSSPRAYSKYEEGAVKPSFEKFNQLLQALDEHSEPVLTLVKKHAG
jgi:predicted RNase H-like HicB family nuclease